MFPVQDDERVDGGLFADVILPFAVKGVFTYRVPSNLAEQVTEGKRVTVQFGKNRIYAGIILSTGDQAPEGYQAKYILDVLDSEPIVGTTLLKFWSWIASYYMCTLGEVMKAALPAGLKLESETQIRLSESQHADSEELDLLERTVLSMLAVSGQISIQDIARETSYREALRGVRSLFDRQLIEIREELQEKFKPKTETSVSLSAFYRDSANLQALFAELERAPKQLELLMACIALQKQRGPVLKKALLERGSSTDATLAALKKKGVFETVAIPVSRLRQPPEPDTFNVVLSPAQEIARQSILSSFATHPVSLLHGVTSSGKTEVYLSLIQSVIQNARQVLYLLPEIALTTQIIQRLEVQFGTKVGLYHSRMTEMERVEVWQKTASGDYQVLLGARSSIFLPFADLALVIVDEEQETSFKQYDPAPRYNGRDAAIYLATLWKAPVLLGSATPSLESYHQASIGRYALIELSERYGGVQNPQIDLIDLRIAAKRKELQGHFSLPLQEAMKQVLDEQQQAIVFQNRRGYAPIVICKVCGHVPKCMNCDVSLTYHKGLDKMVCHYCGFKAEPEQSCAVCGNQSMEEKGLGTEMLEEEINALFPAARVSRMDLDTTRSRNAYEEILSEMENRKIDFLVGTQMVSRGLDFAAVSLTTIVSADSMLNYPDFRAFERSFQLLLQVGGRAGRRTSQGRVIIQTWFPSHPILQQVKNHDYAGMFAAEIKERKTFAYPPFTRLIRIVLKHADAAALGKTSRQFAAQMQVVYGSMAIGPVQALVPRIRNQYIMHMMLKIDTGRHSLKAVKTALQNVIDGTRKDRKSKGLTIQVDVDPY